MKKLFLCIILAAATADARIDWKQTEAVLQVHPTQVSVEAVYEFTNTGKEPVSFGEIEVTCGCLAGKPLKSSYAPGEEGRLVIMLDLRNRYGKQRKKVHVHTLDGQKTVLIVAVDIPRPYVFGTPLIKWSKEDGSTEKRVRLRNPNADPIRLLSAVSSSDMLPVELETIREGYEYEVVVRRRPETADSRSIIRVRTEPPPGLKDSKVIKLYVFSVR